MTPLVLEQLYREDGGRIVASLIRLIGDFDLAEEAAQEALSGAHQGLVSKILRTPLHKLVDDVQDSCVSVRRDRAEFLAELRDREFQVLPANAGVGSRRHLSSVLHALSALTKNLH